MTDNILTPGLVLNLEHTKQLSLLGCEESEESKTRIIALAIAAIEAYQRATESALNLCLRLYQCRQEFASSGEKGWERFCEANFRQYLNLSTSHIRECVRTGEKIAGYVSRRGLGSASNVKGLEVMTLSALKVLGTAPDEASDAFIDRISSKIEEAGKALTAKQVSEELQELKALVEEQKTTISELQQASHRQASQVRERDNAASQLRDQIDQLTRELQKVKSQQVTVVDADPQSQDLQVRRDNIEQEIADRKHQLDQIRSEIAKANATKQALESSNRLKQEAQDAVEQLEEQIKEMNSRWSQSYLKKINNVDPNKYGPIFQRIANDMRALASLIDPQLY